MLLMSFWSGIWEGLGWAVLTWGFSCPCSQMSAGLWSFESANIWLSDIQNGGLQGCRPVLGDVWELSWDHRPEHLHMASSARYLQCFPQKEYPKAIWRELQDLLWLYCLKPSPRLKERTSIPSFNGKNVKEWGHFVFKPSQIRTVIWLVQRHRMWDCLSGVQKHRKGEQELNVMKRIFRKRQLESSGHLCVHFQSLCFGILNTDPVLLPLFRTYQ